MKITYTEKRFGASSLQVIERANLIINEYARQGYNLTLRQLYYQFVSRDWLANNDKNYDRLGSIISDARRAGCIDWNAIVDRTRNVRKPNAWDNPADIIEASAAQYAIDWWKNQPCRPEVWVEKDALVGVLEVACRPWHVPYFSCRGYTSDSEIWAAAQRMLGHIEDGQTAIVIHLGDHDPSGIDMSRDILDRLQMFGSYEIEVHRVALNMDQIHELNPPPNPAKMTDSRYAGYRALHGNQSWELDALNPTYITDLIARQMTDLVDDDEWENSQKEQNEGRRLLKAVADKWNEITEEL